MSTALNREVAGQLETLSAAIAKLREAVEELEGARDAVIRRIDREVPGSRPEIGRITKLTRGRVWQIINPPEVELETEDGQIEFAPDWDALQTADDLYRYAYDEWEQHGSEGSPDDFFPIEAVVHRDRRP